MRKGIKIKGITYRVDDLLTKDKKFFRIIEIQEKGVIVADEKNICLYISYEFIDEYRIY